MNVELNLKEEENRLFVEVTLPQYGGTRGKRALDVRVDVDYVRNRLESLGYELGSGTGPSLRNTRGETSGTYVFEKKKAPPTAPRVEKKTTPVPQEKTLEKEEPQFEQPVVEKEESQEKPKLEPTKKEPTRS